MLGPFQYAFFKITLSLVGLFLIPDGIFDPADVSQELEAAKSKTHLVPLSSRRKSWSQHLLQQGPTGRVAAATVWPWKSRGLETGGERRVEQAKTLGAFFF